MIKLRWVMLVGQILALLAIAHLWRLNLPWPALVSIFGLCAVSNTLIDAYARQVSGVAQWVLAGVISLDILLLTALLYCTGGATNPFSFLYLIHIALATVMLRARWMSLLVTLAAGCFSALFWLRLPLSGQGDAICYACHSPKLHAQSTAMAFALAAALVVYFVRRVTASLAAKEAELQRARDLSERNQRLTSLATLAAGAAHELATPLATIAVISKELERQLVREGSPTASEDAYLIRQEVERCRSVLTHMAADAGAAQGEPLGYVQVGALIDRALSELPHAEQVQRHVAPSAAQAALWVPARSLAQALRAVLKNALEATLAEEQEKGTRSPVTLRAHVVDGRCVMTVLDAGHGMSPDVLARVSEPFFTTKGPGLGMGLGLFLARTLLERLGGSLEVRSSQQQGTTAILYLPLAAPRLEASVV